MSIFFEIHKDIPREGPGCKESTRRAYQLMSGLKNPRILDIGCGPGEQTMELARRSEGEIVALDFHPHFLEELNRRAELNQQKNITTLQGDMFKLTFPEESFDVVWAEGSIYIIGFEKGLSEWRPVLRQGGYMAVSELSWTTNSPSETAVSFWKENYPGMKTVEENVDIIKRCGYEIVDYFTLPESAWWDDYYSPLSRRIDELREKYRDNPEALSQLKEAQAEIDLYKEHSADYGYVFYVMKK